VRPYRIEDELHRGRIVIVAGFQGMSYRREITTLGRGGSDTTAVALAAALRAERCEIYSDVDGVYSADPRVVADAHHLPEVSIDALQELAEGGAKVLCAQAVEWARERGIVIHARRTTDGWYADGGDAGAEPARPQRSNPLQTVVVRDATDACRGVTAHRAAAVCTLPAVQAPALLGWAYEAGMTVFEADIPNAGEALVLLPTATWPDRERMLQALVERFADVRLSSVDVVSIVTQGTEGAPFVGEWLRRAQALATVHRTLARPMRVSLVVDAGQADAVVRVVHEARQQG
jgi:aspartate kinase